MASLNDLRKDYPSYGSMSDGDFLMALRQKFAPEVHPRTFFQGIEGATNAHATIKNQRLKDIYRSDVQKPLPDETPEQVAKRLGGVLEQQSVKTGGKVAEAARSALQGMTLGAGDEIVGGAVSLLPGRDYDTEVARERARLDLGKKVSPKTALAAEIGGALVAPGAAVGKLAKNSGLLTRAAAGLAEGGIGGLVYGFNAGEGGAAARAKDAAKTGLISAGVGGAAPFVGKAAKSIYDGAAMRKAMRNLADKAPSLEDLKAEASRIYAAAENAVLPRAEFAQAAQGMGNRASRHGLDADLTPGAAKVMDRIEGAATSPDPNMSFRELDILRRKASVPAGNITNRTEQAIGAGMKEGIDEYVQNIDPNLSEEISAARQMWSRLRRSDQINEVVEKAKNQASGFENGLRIGFRQILNSPKRRAGFSEPEIKAMEAVVRGTPFGNAMKKIGKLGIGVGQQSNFLGASIGSAGGAAVGSALGPVGSAAGALLPPLLGTGAQKVSERSTQQAVKELEGLVRSGGLLDVQQLPAPVQGLLEDAIRRSARTVEPITR